MYGLRPPLHARQVQRLVSGLRPMTTPDDKLDDVCRGLLYSATGREEVTQETLPLGAALSTLDAAEAAQFARHVDDYVAMRVIQVQGRPVDAGTNT
jgi:hypothetical protein